MPLKVRNIIKMCIAFRLIGQASSLLYSCFGVEEEHAGAWKEACASELALPDEVDRKGDKNR